MLPLPELDDQSFQQIIEDARKMIPQLFAGWTDENYHDPGITLIELLAWLTEMQQYYLNRITDKNELKFLKLMGIKLQAALSSKTEVTFSNVHKAISIPANTRLTAGDQIFETTEALNLLPAQIVKVLVYSGEEYRDFTSFNETRGLSYYAFGQPAKRNNILLIGLDQELPSGVELSLFLHLYEDYPIKPGPPGEYETEMLPLARVSWKYYGLDGENFSWQPLQILRDESLQFTSSGSIKFIIPGPMQAGEFSPAIEGKRFWLGCFLEDDIYELAPRVEAVCINTVSVLQQYTFSEVHHFSSSGAVGMQFKLSSALALRGGRQVQVKEENGDWVFWNEVADISLSRAGEKAFSLVHNEKQELIISFGDGQRGMIPPQGDNNIRLIVFESDFNEPRWLGKSNGLPGQSFKLPVYPLLGRNFMLQVGKRSNTGGDMLWQDWQVVDDFASSRPSDHHYVLDEEQGVIYFGNNENGIIPEQEEQANILLISYRTGGGLRGNIKEYEINRILEDDPDLKLLEAANHRPAFGGRSKETLIEARGRLKREYRKPYRAVSAADFEALALHTPGLRVARVKAVPLYKPGMKNYPHRQEPAQVTVAVMPYSESLTPLPSPAFKENVRWYLNHHRLLSTEIHVVAPDYIRINVYAVVVVAPGTLRAQERITGELERFLQPLDRDEFSRGWPFGRTVYRGDIYEVINRVPGVEYIKELWLSADGNGIRQEHSGDIELPPCGLVYPGDYEIEVINRNDL